MVRTPPSKQQMKRKKEETSSEDESEVKRSRTTTEDESEGDLGAYGSTDHGISKIWIHTVNLIHLNSCVRCYTSQAT